jgi:undecaprenol kinase
MLSFRELRKSFSYAWSGIGRVFWEEQNFRIHIFIAVIVIAFALIIQIQIWELIFLLIIISLILILEIINSILERLLDLIKPRLHTYVKDIKDMTAGIVLIAAVAAILIGILIFFPYLIKALLK